MMKEKKSCYQNEKYDFVNALFLLESIIARIKKGTLETIEAAVQIKK